MSQIPVVPVSEAASSVSAKTLVQFSISAPLEIHFYFSSVVSAAAVALIILVLLYKIIQNQRLFKSFEIDQAEIGVGAQKIKLSPNEIDRQIAYKIWVELSTRKIGLPIDLEHDVVAEIYDSWHAFFSVTRDLVKDVPVRKFRRKDTEEIVRLSIAVLNEGLRPHLTAWQARFRRWYERSATDAALVHEAPQDIQKKFPQYAELSSDLMAVNARLIAYRETMYDLVVAS